VRGANSDKLARWCIMGVQGALLSLLLKEPLYMQSLTVALPAPAPGDAAAARAALYRAVAGALRTSTEPLACSHWTHCLSM
jgi:tRNA-specific adenosine deaminase 1